MRCCSKCFNNHYLTKEIENSLKVEETQCDFCGSFEKTIPSYQLADKFLPFIDLYEQNPNGKKIAELLQCDWGISEHLSLDIFSCLIDSITENEFSNKFYVSRERMSINSIDTWNKFKEELQHSNRFFPTKYIDLDEIQNALRYMKAVDVPKKLYRARVSDGNSFPSDKMLAPPKKLVGNGRANPVGIPYLYTATDINTAISELRPHKGDFISVIELTVNTDNLDIADLSTPRFTSYLFRLNEDQLSELQSQIEFIKHLGEVLSQPVLPNKAELEYLPTQFLCELIKSTNVGMSENKQFDGVMFKSSLGDGKNIALFNYENNIFAGDVQLYQVDDIKYHHSEH
ncbi:MAG: RES family NAD+ phosphorylase [Spirochaetales bacterium]|nr:RES family NAD+ phosphorylase [Spirochaetales bacterium]